MTSTIAMAEDQKGGLVDRFRSLPMARSADLTGRSLTDAIRSVVVQAITVGLAVGLGLGLAVGFRFDSNAGRIALGMVLILAFGCAFCWINATIGIAVKDPERATNAGSGPTFLLLFASNAIVPVATLPGRLQSFARNQPLSVTVSAVRALFEESWCVGLDTLMVACNRSAMARSAGCISAIFARSSLSPVRLGCFGSPARHHLELVGAGLSGRLAPRR